MSHISVLFRLRVKEEEKMKEEQEENMKEEQEVSRRMGNYEGEEFILL